jgi:transposase
MREDRIELLDDELEAALGTGRVERIGFEESYRLGYPRGGPVRIVVARAKYRTLTETGDAQLYTAPRPKELLRRVLIAPSLLAHLLVAKYAMGMPFFRCEEALAREGVELDRGTMCRYAEDAGASLGAIVQACAKEALSTAVCLSTDATGVAIQPVPLADKSRQPCKKGHFFVVLADKDPIFFEVQAKHTREAVCEMFRGYSGTIQADASAIYDALYRGEAVDDESPAPLEVGCWSHGRRKFWEAAVCKHALGREGLVRIGAMFERDKKLSGLPPDKKKRLRQQTVRPLVDDFFEWARQRFEEHKHERGRVSQALGYALRQEAALRRFLEDGRLEMTNNRAERALRSPIAIGRKAWLFFGSDDHAHAAANLFSLLASCRLHGLDPEAYLRDILRVMPYWPRDRYLELAPRYWLQTRARLDPVVLAREVGPIAVPTANTATEQALAS